MAGLVPATHVFATITTRLGSSGRRDGVFDLFCVETSCNISLSLGVEGVDGRDKPGHDEAGGMTARSASCKAATRRRS
jgi:hypothetical protein